MNDDFNSPMLISHLFDAVKLINGLSQTDCGLKEADLQLLRQTFEDFVFDILGLEKAIDEQEGGEKLDEVVQILLELRQKARQERNFSLSDEIRDRLKAAGIEVKDGPEGSSYTLTG
jgi:cysteinyl-tRNA synthetase